MILLRLPDLFRNYRWYNSRESDVKEIDWKRELKLHCRLKSPGCVGEGEIAVSTKNLW